MTDLRAQIRDALREQEDERLSVDEAAAMRRFVVASVQPGIERRTGVSWFQPLAVAATLVVMIAVGIAIGQRFDDRGVPAAAPPGGNQESPGGRDRDGTRQLYFATPGGTRIIWIFNSDLDLKTTP